MGNLIHVLSRGEKEVDGHLIPAIFHCNKIETTL